jgi:transcription initiation factor TFIIIB Brf1 subunit/transcription initiation factor TFIIB
MQCAKCRSFNIEVDFTKGNSYCTNCGLISDDQHVVSDVAFENTKAVGSFIADNQIGPSFLKNRHGNYICDSRQYRINKAYQEIQNIAQKLSKYSIIYLCNF